MDITGLGQIGAGLAALGVIGPGIGIGILTGLAATAIGRNPDATPQIRAQFILGAAFAEGLGVLAIVVAILAIVLKAPGEDRIVDLLAIASGGRPGAFALAAGGAGGPPDQPVLDHRLRAQLRRSSR